MPSILTNFGIDHDFAHSDNVRIAVIIGIVIVLFPLLLKRNLSGLANFSFLGIIAILYVILVIVI